MKKKVLLMGQSGCGKTSMRSLIFSAYRAADTRRLGSTLDVEHSHVRFLGNLVLNLWDCGGQQSYMDSYLDSQRSQVFSAVGVLIYVFDLVSAEGDGEQEWEKDLRYYKDCIEALHQYSPDAQVFCLLHKMDLVDPCRRTTVYSSRVKQLRKKSREVAMAAAKSGHDHGAGFRINCFSTSIWDESLYRAWSSIVHPLIPNVATLERHLSQFAEICSATEVVLFERTTFLVISRFSSVKNAANAAATAAASLSRRQSIDQDQLSFEYDEDDEGMEGFRDTGDRTAGSGAGLGSGFITGTSFNHSNLSTPTTDGCPSKLNPDRFEKVSELIKNFKLSCQRLRSKNSQCQFQALELRNSNFTAYIDALTSNTYIMIIVADPKIQLAAIKLNVQLGRDHFEKLQAINPSRT